MTRHQTIQAAIKGLAVSYHAYVSATASGDSSGIVVWGELLIEDQEATGVEMLPAQNIRRNVGLHRVAKEQISEAA